MLLSRMLLAVGMVHLAVVAKLASALTKEDLVKLHGDFLTKEQLERFANEFMAGTYASRHLQANSDVIDELFANRQAIDRQVEPVFNGVIATTTSDDSYVVDLLRTHVTQMANLQSPIRQGDPLFVSLFQNIEQTRMDYEDIAGGVRVSHTATTDCGLLLVEDHANSVSNFVDTGVRRPNFAWIEPDACANPQLIVDDSTTVIVPTATPTTSPTFSPTTNAPATTESFKTYEPTAHGEMPTSLPTVSDAEPLTTSPTEPTAVVSNTTKDEATTPPTTSSGFMFRTAFPILLPVSSGVLFGLYC